MLGINSFIIIAILLAVDYVRRSTSTMTKDELLAALDMMRRACAPKFDLTTEQLDTIRNGGFPDDNHELKCYTLCIAHLSGTVNKKHEITVDKTLHQIDKFFPEDLKTSAKAALEACKNIQYNYNDPCEKTYYSAKCVYEHNPEVFFFP